MEIVFVDDQEDIRDIISFVLEDALEVTVSSFSNINDAYKHIENKANEISMIISDYHLEGENGLSLFSKVKDFEIPFFLMTGKVFSENDAGIDSFKAISKNKIIQKPIEEELLIGEIKKIL